MSDNKSDPSSGKRPYATLDLKATEIKISPISDKAAPVAQATPAVSSAAVPKPAPASSYASAYVAGTAAKTATASSGQATGSTASSPSASAAAPSNKSATAAPAAARVADLAAAAAAPKEVVVRRGGFFSHLAAGLIGGALALGGWQWGLPELISNGVIPPADGSGTSDLAARIAKLEHGANASERIDNAVARIAAVEKTAAGIADLKEAQSRLVAETKAALASAASDSGAPDQVERLASVEKKLKAMTEAGAGDPNAGRVEQLAALTGKVADLETSMATQLTALRKSVAGDVDARLASATEAAETAKSGTQRIDHELAGVKTEAVRLDERIGTVKTEIDRNAEGVKRGQDELAALKSALDALKGSVAKPADVASAVTPVTQKIAALEGEVKTLAQADETRRSNAERVVLALELQNLKRALDRGAKYDAELAEVEKVSAGKVDLAAIARFKDQGVPTMAELTREFRGGANNIIDAEAAPENGSVVDKLISGAKSVVRVRKVAYDANDTSVEAIVGRMEVALKEGRLADVIREAEALPPKSKAAAAPFVEKVSARASVDSALASLEDKLKTSMSGAPQTPSKTQ